MKPGCGRGGEPGRRMRGERQQPEEHVGAERAPEPADPLRLLGRQGIGQRRTDDDPQRAEPRRQHQAADTASRTSGTRRSRQTCRRGRRRAPAGRLAAASSPPRRRPSPGPADRGRTAGRPQRERRLRHHLAAERLERERIDHEHQPGDDAGERGPAERAERRERRAAGHQGEDAEPRADRRHPLGVRQRQQREHQGVARRARPEHPFARVVDEAVARRQVVGVAVGDPGVVVGDARRERRRRRGRRGRRAAPPPGRATTAVRARRRAPSRLTIAACGTRGSARRAGCSACPRASSPCRCSARSAPRACSGRCARRHSRPARPSRTASR